MTKLTTLDLGSNPLTFPPPEIVKQGTAAILAYLQEQLDGRQQGVSKLLLVGEGGVGKTSLLRSRIKTITSVPFNLDLSVFFAKVTLLYVYLMATSTNQTTVAECLRD